MRLGHNSPGTCVDVLGERDDGHTPVADNGASVPGAVCLLSDEVHVPATTNAPTKP